MNMEEIKRQGRIIIDNTIEQLEDEYRNLLIEYRRKYFYQIIEVILSNIRGIPEHRLEEWIEDNLISDIKSTINHNLRKMHGTIEPEFEFLLRKLSSSNDIARIIESYQETLDSITRRDNLDWLEDLSQEFIKQINRKIENYTTVFLGIDDRNLERAIENINIELRTNLRRVNNQFQEEYQAILKHTMKQNSNKLLDKLQELRIQESTMPKEYIPLIEQILGYSGYQVIQNNDKLYVQDKETQEMIELVYDSHYDTIKAKDESFGIKIPGEQLLFVDKKQDTIMAIAPLTFEMSNLKSQFRMKISQGFEGYEFEYGNKKVTDLGEISTIIDSIKSKAPGYYAELMQQKDFQELMTRLEQYEKEHEEIYVDKTDNKIKVNAQTKELVSLKLKLFGYQLLEKEDGLYAVDLKTNETHKIKVFGNSFGFEDKKAIEFNFNTSLTVRTPNSIVLNNIELHQGNNNLFINQDLTRFHVFIHNNMYKVEITNDGLNCIARDKDGNVLLMGDKDILATIQEVFPYVTEYIQEKIAKKQKTSNNPQEEKVLLEMAKSVLEQTQVNTENLDSTGPKRK